MQSTEYYLSNNYHNDSFVFEFYPVQSMDENQFKDYLSKIDNIFKDESDKDNLKLFWEISRVQRTICRRCKKRPI